MSQLPQNLGVRSRQQRFNPLRQLTPLSLTNALDGFEAGYLRQAALIWEAIEQRDDTAQISIPKRRKDVSRRPFEIIKLDESLQAEKDEEALKFFYNNLTATNAIDQNMRGGFRLLVNQMMNAVFYQYAAHEICYQPRKSETGRQLLTAEFRYVPLYFFENRTGALRYTGPDGYTDGAELTKDGWMITTGDGLHKAISICRTLKQLSLQDWVNYSEKFGIPGIHGETPAAKGTAEWDAFIDALDNFANDWITASGQGTKINLIEPTKTGDAPFAPMVERMDRRITALCRGADLGTLSSQDGAGASLQGEETDLLLEDDCANISEALNIYVDRYVLRWLNGPNHHARAYVKLLPPVQTDTKLEIEIDKHLLENGGELDAAETYERYNRNLPDDMKDVRLKKGSSATTEPTAPDADPKSNQEEVPDKSPEELAAENDATEAFAETLGVPVTWLAPVRDLLAGLESKAKDETITDTELLGALEAAAAKLPELFENLDTTDLAELLEAAYGRGLMRGVQESENKGTSKK